MSATNYSEIHVYCDEEADRALFFQLASASKCLWRIPQENVSVYGGFRSLRPEDGVLTALITHDRPDFIFTYQGRPFLVSEVTEHGYTGDNGLQRFTRFATTAELGVPFIYFTPFARTRDDELDAAIDLSSLSKRRVNSNVFAGMVRLSEIFRVPSLAIEWPVSTINGKPIKLGRAPTSERIRQVFGGLMDAWDLFASRLANTASQKRSIMTDPRVASLLDTVRAVAAEPNVRSTAVRIELPGHALLELAFEPKRLLVLQL